MRWTDKRVRFSVTRHAVLQRVAPEQDTGLHHAVAPGVTRDETITFSTRTT